MPRTIAAVVASDNKATLIELQTVYGIEDMFDILEVLAVEAHNARVMNEKA